MRVKYTFVRVLDNFITLYGLKKKPNKNDKSRSVEFDPFIQKWHYIDQ